MWEPDRPSRTYPHHHVDTNDRSRSWAPQPRDFAARTLTIARLNRPDTQSRVITARLGTTWTNSPGTGTRTPSYRRNPRLYHPAFTTSPPSLAMYTKSGRLLRPRETDARPLTTFRAPTHRTLRPARNGLPGYRHSNTPGFPEPSHGYYESKQASAYSSEPQPSMSRDQTYAWPPPPRDLDNDHAESLASTEDEPDYSFAAVTDMIRTFHDIEKPTTAAPSRTATTFDQMRGLQNDRAPVFHLPTSPLLGGLIDDVNTTLARLVEEQSSGFIPFPMKRHQRFYRTAAPSLSAPYAVPPSLALLTHEKSSGYKRRPILLPYLVLTRPGIGPGKHRRNDILARLVALHRLGIPQGSLPLGRGQL